MKRPYERISGISIPNIFISGLKVDKTTIAHKTWKMNFNLYEIPLISSSKPRSSIGIDIIRIGSLKPNNKRQQATASPPVKGTEFL